MAAPASEKTFRQYLAFFVGQQFSLLGSSIAQFAIIWWITLETASTLYLSLAAFVGFIPMVVLGFFTGVIADRFDRKKIVGLADTFQALSTVLLIALFVLGWASVNAVLVLLALRGVCQAFHAPTVSAILPSMVPQDKLNQINSLEYVLRGMINVLGPVIAAILLTFLSIEQILWVDPATFVIAILFLLITKIPSVGQSREATSFKQDFVQGFSLIKGIRGLLPLIFLATILNFLLAPLSTLLPYFVKFAHSGNAGDLALVEVALQVGMLAGGVFMLMGKGFKKKIPAFVVSCLVVFAGYALLSFAPTGAFWFMAAAGFALAFPLPIANVSTSTILQTVVPLGMQGRVNAVVMSLASLATPIGMILSGVLANYFGTANLFLASAIAGIVVLLPSWFLTGIRHVESAPAADARAISPGPSSHPP